MRLLRHLCIYLLTGILLGGSALPAVAITAEEQLTDPVLETRARELSKQLRCLVCQNQSIDDSDADLARDLRREVRAQITAGKDDSAILADLQSRYGDYVLLRPPVTFATSLLWLAPILALLAGAGLLFASRRPSHAAARQNRREIVRHTPPSTNTGRTDPGTFSLPFVAALFAGLLICAGLVYWFVLGSPYLPAQPLHGRAQELAQLNTQSDKEMQQRLADFTRAQTATKSQPQDIGNWLRYALAAAALGRIDSEIAALRTALTLSAGDPAIKSMLAEALSRSADGQVIPEARALAAEVLNSQPDDPRALFLSGMAAMQDGAYERALYYWQQLAGLSRPDAPWMAFLQENMAEAAEKAGLDMPQIPMLPDAESIQAAQQMTPDERRQMIEQMVEQLRERLESNPGDAAGWLRLARSYDVLERPHEALSAHASAAAARPDDLSLQLGGLERILSAGFSQSYLEMAEIFLHRARVLAENHPEVLFFGGHFARAGGDDDRARSLWSQLLAMMPADSETASLLRLELDKLNR